MSDVTHNTTVPRRSGLELLYSGIWLLFLGFPLTTALLANVHLGWKILACAATAAFVALYLWLFWQLNGPGELRVVGRLRNRFIAVVLLLAALAALTVPASGPWASAFTPFLAAAIVFGSPLVPGIAVSVGVWFLPSAVAAQLSGTLWTLLGPGFGVAIIVFARLVEHNENRAQEAQTHLRLTAEREAIARDVHDVLGHTLTVLSIKAQLARRLVDRDVEAARRELDAIDDLARSSLTQIRSTVTRLRTASFAAELESARTALDAASIEADITADPDLPDRHDLFAWALREAVTNTVRHAGATRCRITATPGRLTLEDDGVGPGTSRGNGLTGLAERAHDAGARLTVRAGSGPAERPGTIVEVTR